jgi:tetratricopeptide (TPR) repeat protein
MYRENPEFFYLLGVSCLYTGDYGGAHSYLRRSAQLTEDDAEALVGLAAVHLKRRENQEALRLWLEVLDQRPKHRVARRGLALLQKTDDPVRLSEELSDSRIQRLFPTPGFAVPRWLWVVAIVSVLGVAGWNFGPTLVREIAAELGSRRPGYEVLDVENKPEVLTTPRGEFRYVLTSAEIESTYERVGRLFNDFRDNLARREMNRLLLSNASEALKERLRLLADYTTTPDFTSFRDNFDYDEVAAEPWLHHGCFVRWKGRATNVVIADDAITFDFLVGYHTDEVLEGIVPARLGFAARVDAGDPLEVIAQLRYASDGLRLDVTSVRRLAPEDRS